MKITPAEYTLAIAPLVSKKWSGELVKTMTVVAALEDNIETSQMLDKIKRALFYGDASPRGLNETGNFDLPAQSDCDLVHGIIGMITESGELGEALLEALLKHIRGDGAVLEIDRVNMVEEIGDQLWYIALALRALGSSFEDAMTRNLAKLSKRFPDNFKADSALNRNLAAEREALSK